MNQYDFNRFLGYAGMLSGPTANAAVTTVGAATLTGAQLVGRVITRTGSTAAYTDTTPTITALVAALPPSNNPVYPLTWMLSIRNNTAFFETLAAGTGCTLSGVTVIPPFSSVSFLVSITAASTYTMLGVGLDPIVTNAAEVVITTNVITAAENGATFYLALVGGFTSTLPTPFLGGFFRFIIQIAPTTAYIITTSGGSNILYGHFVERAGGAGVAGAAQDTQNFVASQAIIGDWAEYYSDGTNWYVHGMVNVIAGATFAVT